MLALNTKVACGFLELASEHRLFMMIKRQNLQPSLMLNHRNLALPLQPRK